jgi:PEP-CTERM motif
MRRITHKTWTAASWATAVLLPLAGAAPGYAGAILSPISASPLGLVPTSHIIDESGLSSLFITRVTDYDTYVAGNPTPPTHAFISATNGWASPTSFAGKFIEFDLENVYSIMSFALWTQSNTSAVNSFTLSSAMDQNFTQGVTNLGTFNAAMGLSVQTFTVSGIGEFVKLQINSGHGATTVNIGEVAFDVNVVPEPTGLALIGIGLGGIGLVRRRRYTAA